MSDTRRYAVHTGTSYPLGATPDRDGTNIAVFSEHAAAIEICLFDVTGSREVQRLRLPDCIEGVFHGRVDGLRPGQLYGLRAHGPWRPERGHRFNPHKLLLDPYARALRGRFAWQGGHLIDPAEADDFDPRDTVAWMPKCVVSEPAEPPPRGGEGPNTPLDASVLYEVHVRGMSKLHPVMPEAMRGTYQGLTHPRLLDHLVKLGITAVELMPVMAFLDEYRLMRMGLANHWGYNPFAFFVPDARYAIRDPSHEFASLVAALHHAGIEVILDVVYNHTAETDELGPTLSFRGLDNATYYRLDPEDPRRYVNWTGCGNTLDITHPRVLQLVMDSLRHWAALGVDGFRFDLGPVTARGVTGEFERDHPFFQAIAQDPMLARLKMIAEPWDLGAQGYRLGEFPPPFAMWNDRFRDSVRRFWRGDEAVLPELAARLLGSADLLEGRGRPPQASLNYVTSHDGFTLHDLVTYAGKHNQANGEGNRDGHHDEASANYGVEGESDDAGVLALRARQKRNLVATLLLAQGTPMLLMGDELHRTQKGNNNAYCQDNATSWVDWSTAPEGETFTRFVRRVVELRRRYPGLRRRYFLHARQASADGVASAEWLSMTGEPLSADAWQDPALRCVGLLLSPETSSIRPQSERHEVPLFLLLNGTEDSVGVTLPSLREVSAWTSLLDTRSATGGEQARVEEPIELDGPCLVLLRGER